MWQKSQTEFHAWAAGAFEAGGTIGPTRVSLQTTDKEITADLEQVFGGSTRTRASTTFETGLGSTGKVNYIWLLTGTEDLRRFLGTLLPYFHPKRKEDAQKTLAELYRKDRR